MSYHTTVRNTVTITFRMTDEREHVGYALRDAAVEARRELRRLEDGVDAEALDEMERTGSIHGYEAAVDAAVATWLGCKTVLREICDAATFDLFEEQIDRADEH